MNMSISVKCVTFLAIANLIGVETCRAQSFGNAQICTQSDGNFAYTQQCAQSGVATPPLWTPDTLAWQFLGSFTSTELLALVGNPQDGELWVWDDPSGGTICLAFPRFNAGSEPKEYQSVGIICQSGCNACFYDTYASTNATPPLDPCGTNLFSGNAGIENCANCHKGQDAFIITPPLQSYLSNYQGLCSTGFYQPIGSTNGNLWTNPDSDPGKYTDCKSCHAIPALTAEYCSAVILPLISGPSPAMPPSPEVPVDYPSINTIKADCCNLVDPWGDVFTNYSCAGDRDGDGILDTLDSCPDDFAAIDMNLDGCNDDDETPPFFVDSQADNSPSVEETASADAAGVNNPADNDLLVEEPFLETADAPSFVEVDRDGDGIPDSQDFCPDEFAVLDTDLNGCNDDDDDDDPFFTTTGVGGVGGAPTTHAPWMMGD
jgi:hypothetical protein